MSSGYSQLSLCPSPLRGQQWLFGGVPTPMGAGDCSGDVPHRDLIAAGVAHWLLLLFHLFIARPLPAGIQQCLIS